VVGVPVQPLADGVMVIVAVTGAEVAFVAVKAGIFPDPLAERPMVELLFVQVKVVPGTLPEIVVTGTDPLLQYV
jgi:hypothetical protein